MSNAFPGWLNDPVLLRRVAARLSSFSSQIERPIEPDDVHDLLVDRVRSIPAYVEPYLASPDPNKRSQAEDCLARICRQTIQDELRKKDGDPRFCLYRQLQRALSHKEGLVTETSTIGTWYAPATVNPVRYDDMAFERTRGEYVTWNSPRETVSPYQLRNSAQTDYRTLALFFAGEVERRIAPDLWIPLFALRDFIAENYDLGVLYPGSAMVPLNERAIESPVISAYDNLVIEETLQKIERLRSLHELMTLGAINEWLRRELQGAPYLIDEVLHRIEDPETRGGVS